MFKLTVYKKVNISRNVRVFLFIICLIAVGGKMVLAHEKVANYKEALQLFQSGELMAAEKKFRVARLNPAVRDYNQEMDEKLAILTPIREIMEDIAKRAAKNYEARELENLVKTYERWQKSKEEWLEGTAIQKDMYEEMAAHTKLQKEFHRYFSDFKKVFYGNLQGGKLLLSADEEAIFEDLKLIPSEYFGGDTAKTNEIEAAFLTYYSLKMDDLIAGQRADLIVEEGNRQFGMLRQFSIDSEWLKETLDTQLLTLLTKAIDKNEYSTFAEQADSVKKLSSIMAETKVMAFIETTKSNLLANAENLIANNKYEEAISIYEALKRLEDTSDLIANAEIEWDKFEPIRVLKRLYSKEFTNSVNARNLFGAESVVVAISQDKGIYFGRLKGKEPMVVIEGRLEELPTVEKLSFQSGLSNNPVVFIQGKSQRRTHHYFAYEIRNQMFEKILDIEADNLTIESSRVLVENAMGQGEGEFAYYEAAMDGVYRFKEIKKDYLDIEIGDIDQHFGKKVRFDAFVVSKQSEGALVKISETYNYETRQYERSYVLLKSKLSLNASFRYSVIGIFSGYETITIDTGETIDVPVVQVEKTR